MWNPHIDKIVPALAMVLKLPKRLFSHLNINNTFLILIWRGIRDVDYIPKDQANLVDEAEFEINAEILC
jgi:hypothetical protein